MGRLQDCPGIQLLESWSSSLWLLFPVLCIKSLPLCVFCRDLEELFYPSQVRAWALSFLFIRWSTKCLASNSGSSCWKEWSDSQDEEDPRLFRCRFRLLYLLINALSGDVSTTSCIAEDIYMSKLWPPMWHAAAATERKKLGPTWKVRFTALNRLGCDAETRINWLGHLGEIKCDSRRSTSMIATAADYNGP
ncbi:hypothetical protein R1flu_006118 [Riccia fluitans]|uniref:Uncharacterized protein n=1 Tax=Riccia fluitans TaxID=41844 RepID=A0ABD1YV43_9MARC